MLILIGPSASGKTEVAKCLSNNYKITKIVTYTTRNPRVNEQNGVDYNFVNVDDFVKMADDNFFVETTYYNNNYYGTAKKDIKDDKCVILDPNGLKSFLALNDSRIVSIYLDCNENIRYQRMLNRKDDNKLAKQRIINDRIAFNKSNLSKVDYVVDSNELSIEQLSKKIYQLYINHLNNL